MMKLSIRGKNTELGKADLRDALQFFGSYLMTNRLLKNLYIELWSKTDTQQSYEASVIFTDSSYRPRSFEMNLRSSMRPERQLRALAHEMVHVKQFARGEMRDYDSGSLTRWGDQLYERTDEPSVYFSLPWEKEAYVKEIELYDAYIDHLKNQNRFVKGFHG